MDINEQGSAQFNTTDADTVTIEQQATDNKSENCSTEKALETSTSSIAQRKPSRELILHVFNTDNSKGGATALYDPKVGLLAISFCHIIDHYNRKTAVVTARRLISEAVMSVLLGARPPQPSPEDLDKNPNLKRGWQPLFPRVFFYPLFSNYKEFSDTACDLILKLAQIRADLGQISVQEEVNLVDTISFLQFNHDCSIYKKTVAELVKQERDVTPENISKTSYLTLARIEEIQEVVNQEKVISAGQTKNEISTTAKKTKAPKPKRNRPTPEQIATFKDQATLKKATAELEEKRKLIDELTLRLSLTI
jgi:hypothetical protein